MRRLETYVVTLAALLIIDAVWLALMTPIFYKPQLQHILALETNVVAAGLFYLLYATAIMVLVVLPARAAGSGKRVFMTGAVLGLASYGTYDLTNLAIAEGWPLAVTVVDMAWGMVLTATVSVITYAWIRRRHR